jgi:hypothetical protein
MRVEHHICSSGLLAAALAAIEHYGYKLLHVLQMFSCTFSQQPVVFTCMYTVVSVLYAYTKYMALLCTACVRTQL